MSVRADASVLRFGVVGLLNTFAGLAIIYAAKGFFGAGDVQANATGYGAGMLLSFGLNRRWTFGHRGDAAPAFLRFAAVLGMAYFSNLLTVLSALSLGVGGYAAQALGVIPYAAIAYFGSKHVVFVAASTAARSREGAST